MKKIGMFCNLESPSGCDYYRAILPVRHCYAPLLKEGIHLEFAESVFDADKYDAVVVHRHIDDFFTRRLLFLMTKGKKVLWDHDDLMTNMPEWNPLVHVWKDSDRERWEVIKNNASFVSSSTKNLARFSGIDKNDKKNTFVLPNLIDVSDYLPYHQNRNHKDPVRIVWAGSETHSKDLNMIVDPLNRIIKEFGNKVEVRFFGYMPSDMTTHSFCKVLYTPKCSTNLYTRTLCYLKPDIGLCPLVDHPFNQAKSSCKLLEYCAAGAVVIHSPLGEYQECDLGIESESLFWYENIKNAVERNMENLNSRKDDFEKLIQNHSWQSKQAMSPWMEAFRTIVA